MENKNEFTIKRNGTKLIIKEGFERTLTPPEAIGTLNNMETQLNKMTNDKYNLEKQIQDFETKIKKFKKEADLIKQILIKTIQADTTNKIQTMKLTKAQLTYNQLKEPETLMIARHELITEIMKNHQVTPDNPLSSEIRNIVDEQIKKIKT